MMKKVINPALCEVYGGRKAKAFAKIEYESGRLSICGVIGPRSDGNCSGSAGQCYEEIAKGEPAESWSKDMLDKFIDIWKRWHLNDMRPYCACQKEMGWDKEALEKVTIYHYRLTSDASKRSDEAKNAAQEALKNGETFTPTKEQVMYANLPYSTSSIGKELNSPYYELKKPLYPGDSGAVETKERGWIRYDEDPIGILCKPCPVCGHKYGTSWLKEEVPQDVIEWLFHLPNSSVTPAWV